MIKKLFQCISSLKNSLSFLNDYCNNRIFLLFCWGIYAISRLPYMCFSLLLHSIKRVPWPSRLIFCTNMNVRGNIFCVTTCFCYNSWNSYVSFLEETTFLHDLPSFYGIYHTQNFSRYISQNNSNFQHTIQFIVSFLAISSSLLYT